MPASGFKDGDAIEHDTHDEPLAIPDGFLSESSLTTVREWRLIEYNEYKW